MITNNNKILKHGNFSNMIDNIYQYRHILKIFNELFFINHKLISKQI